MSSKLNKSTTALGASASFTGQWDYINRFQGVSVLVKTDQDGTVKLHFSNDAGTTTDHTEQFSVTGGTDFFKLVEKKGDHCKVEYVNGSVAQTSLVLRTIYRDTSPEVEFDSSDAMLAKQSGSWSMSVSNFPATQAVSNTNLDALSLNGSNHLQVATQALSSGTDSVSVLQATATNLNTTAEMYTGGAAVTSSNPVHVSQTNTSNGSEGNLFDAVSVTTTTDSSTVDVSSFGKARILLSGSDTTNFNGFDVYVSKDNSAWYLDSTIYPSSSGGDGSTLSSRMASVSIELHGVDYLKVTSYDTETVTGTVIGDTQ